MIKGLLTIVVWQRLEGRKIPWEQMVNHLHYVAHCLDSWENIARENREEINSKSDIFQTMNILKCYLLVIIKRIVYFSVVIHVVMRYIYKACSSTVCGEKWLSCYFEPLDESDKDKV